MSSELTLKMNSTNDILRHQCLFKVTSTKQASGMDTSSYEYL